MKKHILPDLHQGSRSIYADFDHLDLHRATTSISDSKLTILICIKALDPSVQKQAIHLYIEHLSPYMPWMSPPKFTSMLHIHLFRIWQSSFASSLYVHLGTESHHPDLHQWSTSIYEKIWPSSFGSSLSVNVGTKSHHLELHQGSTSIDAITDHPALHRATPFLSGMKRTIQICSNIHLWRIWPSSFASSLSVHLGTESQHPDLHQGSKSIYADSDNLASSISSHLGTESHQPDLHQCSTSIHADFDHPALHRANPSISCWKFTIQFCIKALHPSMQTLTIQLASSHPVHLCLESHHPDLHQGSASIYAISDHPALHRATPSI